MNPEPSPEPIKRPDMSGRMKEIQRIAAEIEKARKEILADRQERPPAELSDEERLQREAWNDLMPEEKEAWARDLQTYLEEHRDEIKADAIPGVNADEAVARIHKSAEQVAKLARLEEELTELVLQSHADHAEASARLALCTAEMMNCWENMTEDQWQALSPEDRGNMLDMLNEWNGGQKYEYLSQLPIEIRRRFEA